MRWTMPVKVVPWRECPIPPGDSAGFRLIGLSRMFVPRKWSIATSYAGRRGACLALKAAIRPRLASVVSTKTGQAFVERTSRSAKPASWPARRKW